MLRLEGDLQILAAVCSGVLDLTFAIRARAGWGANVKSTPLAQFDLFADLVRQADAAEGENHLGRQFLVTLETAAGKAITHRLFDFALRGDADFFQKSAQAGVEDVFIHENLLIYGRTGLFSMYSPRSRCFLSTRAMALLRCASR